MAWKITEIPDEPTGGGCGGIIAFFTFGIIILLLLHSCAK